ncbi:hypothetical protein [Candidatus Odyssella thessalonicensis]|uniref:hypothetical protein n=1 Tax=Candidatus Odyssella thessalonicensis TaxID=84647 RepID=UPI000225AEAA|nr:hypothetical protein [Candidatus Odyssella thessalonicensis]
MKIKHKPANQLQSQKQFTLGCSTLQSLLGLEKIESLEKVIIQGCPHISMISLRSGVTVEAPDTHQVHYFTP